MLVLKCAAKLRCYFRKAIIENKLGIIKVSNINSLVALLNKNSCKLNALSLQLLGIKK
jgi:hypothetical protein